MSSTRSQKKSKHVGAAVEEVANAGAALEEIASVSAAVEERPFRAA